MVDSSGTVDDGSVVDSSGSVDEVSGDEGSVESGAGSGVIEVLPDSAGGLTARSAIVVAGCGVTSNDDVVLGGTVVVVDDVVVDVRVVDVVEVVDGGTVVVVVVDVVVDVDDVDDVVDALDDVTLSAAITGTGEVVVVVEPTDVVVAPDGVIMGVTGIVVVDCAPATSWRTVDVGAWVVVVVVTRARGARVVGGDAEGVIGTVVAVDTTSRRDDTRETTEDFAATVVLDAIVATAPEGTGSTVGGAAAGVIVLGDSVAICITDCPPSPLQFITTR